MVLHVTAIHSIEPLTCNLTWGGLCQIYTRPLITMTLVLSNDGMALHR